MHFRIPALATWVLLGGVPFFLFIATWRLHLPGLYYDEVLYMPASAQVFEDCSIRGAVHIRAGCIPILLQPPYLGSAKALFYGLWHNFVPVTPETVRLPVLALLLASILLYARSWTARIGPLLGSALGVLLLTDVVAITHARVDWGPYAIAAATKMVVVCLALSWLETKQPWCLVGLVGAAAFGVFDKLNFLWVAGSLAIAMVLVFGRECVAGLRSLTPLAGLILLAMGSYGLFWLVRGIVPIVSAGIDQREFNLLLQAQRVWHLLDITLDAGAYQFFFLEQWPGPRIHAGIAKTALVLGLVVAISLPWIATRLGDTGVVRLARTCAFMTLLTWGVILAMILTKETGGSHHLVAVTQLWQTQLVTLAGTLLAIARALYAERTFLRGALRGAAGLAFAVLVIANLQSGRIWVEAYDPRKPTRPTFTPAIYELARAVDRHGIIPIVAVDWGIGTNLVTLVRSGRRALVLDYWPVFVDVGKGSKRPGSVRSVLGEVQEALFVMRDEAKSAFPESRRGFDKAIKDGPDCQPAPEVVRDPGGVAQFAIVRLRTSCLVEH